MAPPRVKAVCDHLPALCARRIARDHRLAPGSFTPGYQFATPMVDREGRACGTVRIEVLSADLVEVSVGAIMPQRWPLTVLRSSLRANGGWRWWWECPTCKRRCAVIYPLGDRKPGCRICMGLVYRTQAQTRQARAVERTMRAYRKLGWNPGAPATWTRPKGMWGRTYDRLAEQIEQGWRSVRDELTRVRRFSEAGSGNQFIGGGACHQH